MTRAVTLKIERLPETRVFLPKFEISGPPGEAKQNKTLICAWLQ